MANVSWEEQFKAVYDRGVVAWNEGRRSPQTMFSTEDARFLEGIGCSAQELFDFVDDLQRYGEPDYETVLAIQTVCRDHFLNVMKGRRSGRTALMSDLPAKAEAVDGIPWLPRLIMKARLKLRCEMPSDLMFGCGGDRAFFGQVTLTPAAFLELVRGSGSDDRRIIDAVKKAWKQ
jgi:hypothetical protein